MFSAECAVITKWSNQSLFGQVNYQLTQHLFKWPTCVYWDNCTSFQRFNLNFVRKPLTAFVSREVFIQRAHSVGHIEFVLHVDSFHRAHAVTIGHIDEPPTRATGHEVTSARTDKNLSIQKGNIKTKCKFAMRENYGLLSLFHVQTPRLKTWLRENNTRAGLTEVQMICFPLIQGSLPGLVKFLVLKNK